MKTSDLSTLLRTRLSDEDFQMLVHELVLLDHPSARPGGPGKDKGADIWDGSPVAGGIVDIWQAKHWRYGPSWKSAERSLESSLVFARDVGFAIGQWTLCIPLPMNILIEATWQKRIIRRAAAAGVEAVLWTADDLNELLRRPDTDKAWELLRVDGRRRWVDDRPPLELLGLEMNDVVARPWLAKQTSQFMATNRSGYIVIEGSPGTGKSVALATMAQARQWIFHRVEHGRRDRDAEEAAFRELSSKIAASANMPELADTPATDISRQYQVLFQLAAQRAAALTRVRKSQAAATTDRSRLVVAIDGIPTGVTSGSALSLPQSLPAGVFVIVTKVPGWSPLGSDAARMTINLDERTDEQKEDLSKFIAGRLATSSALRRSAVRIAQEWDNFVRLLLTLAHGSWLYVRYVLDDLESGRGTWESASTLPVGLDSYYLDRIVRLAHELPGDWTKVGRPFLGTLAAVAEPVSWEDLLVFAGLPDNDIASNPAVQAIMPFVQIDHVDRLELHHDSLRTFVQTGSAHEQERDHRVLRRSLAAATDEANRRIADHLLAVASLDATSPTLARLSDAVSGYGLRHIGLHLMRERRCGALSKLVTVDSVDSRGDRVNEWFSLLENSQVGALFDRDVAFAWECLTEDPEAGGTASLRNALILSSLRSIAAGASPELIAFAARSGAWSPFRSLAAALRIPRRRDRDRALSLLMSHLPPELGVIASERMVDHGVVHEMRPADDVVLNRELPTAARQPSDKQVADYEAVIASVTDPLARARLTAELLTEVNDADLRMRLSTSLVRDLNGVRDSGDVVAVLSSAWQYMPTSMVERAANAGVRIADEAFRVEAMAALWPSMSPQMQQQSWERVATWAAHLTDQHDVVAALSSLASIADDRHARDIADAASRLNGDTARREARWEIVHKLNASALACLEVTDLIEHPRDAPIARVYASRVEGPAVSRLQATLPSLDPYTRLAADVALHARGLTLTEMRGLDQLVTAAVGLPAVQAISALDPIIVSAPEDDAMALVSRVLSTCKDGTHLAAEYLAIRTRIDAFIRVDSAGRGPRVAVGIANLAEGEYGSWGHYLSTVRRMKGGIQNVLLSHAAGSVPADELGSVLAAIENADAQTRSNVIAILAKRRPVDFAALMGRAMNLPDNLRASTVHAVLRDAASPAQVVSTLDTLYDAGDAEKIAYITAVKNGDVPLAPLLSLARSIRLSGRATAIAAVSYLAPPSDQASLQDEAIDAALDSSTVPDLISAFPGMRGAAAVTWLARLRTRSVDRQHFLSELAVLAPDIAPSSSEADMVAAYVLESCTWWA